MLSRLSGSKLELAAHCLYWAREDVPLPTAQEASAAMALGNATHTAAEEDTDLALQDAFLAATTEANIDAIAERFKITDAATDKLRDLYGQWVSWWEVFSQGKPWRPEVPYAWNVVTRTARELPKGEHRDYSMVDRRVEIPCTVDVTLAETGRVHVVDYKTGHSKQVPAVRNRQLACGALCAAYIAGVDVADVTLAKIDRQRVWTDHAELSSWDLEALADEMAAWHAAITDAAPCPGKHCTGLYCPALPVCPVGGPRAVLAVGPELPELAAGRSFLGPVVSHRQAAAIKRTLPMLDAVLKERKLAIAEWAEANGGRIDMGDGTFAVRETMERRTVNADGAFEVVRDEFGEQAAQSLVTRRISSSKAIELARARAPRGKKKDAEEAFWQKLEAAGAVRVATYRKWAEETEE